MFGGSFSELALIFVVALIVLGPTRLPGLVRTVGRWVGKARMMARDFQQQLENEINLDELNRINDVKARAAAPASSAEATPSTPSSPHGETVAAGGYPYAAAAPQVESVSAAGHPGPKPGDDTYSHAHGSGEMAAIHEGANPHADPKKDDAA